MYTLKHQEHYRKYTVVVDILKLRSLPLTFTYKNQLSSGLEFKYILTREACHQGDGIKGL